VRSGGVSEVERMGRKRRKRKPRWGREGFIIALVRWNYF